jgi:hypothetical protein
VNHENTKIATFLDGRAMICFHSTRARPAGSPPPAQAACEPQVEIGRSSRSAQASACAATDGPMARSRTLKRARYTTFRADFPACEAGRRAAGTLATELPELSEVVPRLTRRRVR